jgi:hypothetical protein
MYGGQPRQVAPVELPDSADEQDTLSPVADTHVARLWKVLFFVL